MRVHLTRPSEFINPALFQDKISLFNAGSSPREIPHQGAFSGSANVPEPTQLVEEQRENKFKSGARVAYARGLRRITLQRYIVSRLVYWEQEVSFTDVVVLYDNILWLQDMCERNPDFQKKFGKQLSLVAEILKGTRFSSNTITNTRRKLSHEFKTKCEDFLFPRRNMPGIQRYVHGKYAVHEHRESGTARKQLPQPRRIGVGYKDKGHRRDPAWDGSPRWQDVAQSEIKP